MAVGALFRALEDTASTGSQLLRGGGAAAGGLYGWEQSAGEPEGERLLQAAGYGMLGGMAIPGMLRSASIAKEGPDKVANFLYYNYLSSPDTIARANLGAVGGMLVHALEEASKGNLSNANKLLTGVVRGSGRWYDVMRGSKDEVRNIRKSILGDEYAFELGEEFRDVGLGKWYTAGDIAAVEALKETGMTTREAMRMTLTGIPESKIGAWIVNTQSAMLKDGGYAGRLLAGTAMPFARVGVTGREQGLKRTPLLGLAMGGPGKTGRQLSGGLAGYAGYQAEENLDPRLATTIGTAAGPAYLPFIMGRGLHKGLRSTPQGELPRQIAGGLGGALQGVKEFSPLGFAPLGLFTNPLQELPRRAIPAAVSDVAAAVDPEWKRLTSPDTLEERARQGLTPEYQSFPGMAALMSRIPGDHRFGRESLPIDYMPVGPTGEPRFSSFETLGAKRPSEPAQPPHPLLGNLVNEPLYRGFTRTMAPTREGDVPPLVDYRDPQERALYEMGITPSAPSPRGSLFGMPFDPSQDAASQMQLLRGMGPEIGRQLLSSPGIQQRILELARTNPAMARMLAQMLYGSVAQGVGSATGMAANVIGMNTGRSPFGGPRGG